MQSKIYFDVENHGKASGSLLTENVELVHKYTVYNATDEPKSQDNQKNFSRKTSIR